MTTDVPADSTASTPDDSDGIAPETPVRIDGKSELDELVATEAVVLVDFYADWCGPCKMLEPIVERLAADTGAAVGTVDVDANQALAATYGVRGVPSMVLFADGEQVEQLVGLRGEQELRDLLGRYTDDTESQS